MEIYYIRDSKGNIQLERVEDPDEKYDETLNEFGAREAEWYLCPMETKTACIMEPYNYEITKGYTELMTTLVVPIMNGQEFAGVVGVDINLEILQETVKAVSQQLYDGQSRVTLLREQGLIVAASHNSDALARPLAEVMPELPRATALAELDEIATLLSERLRPRRSANCWSVLLCQFWRYCC